jgi:putative MFS transporter
MVSERFTAYQRRLFIFLSVATFFEGYDFLALTQILPNLRADMGLDQADAGRLVGFINLGTVAAYLLVRGADRWGRRRVLTVTIAGYTLFTFLSGLAPNVYAFAVLQMLARIFLIGEWAISMVIAAEEFPAARRGMVIGVISAFSSLGAITCAGVVPSLLKSAYGWRTVYFVGIIPLIVLAFARRSLRETRRFEELAPATRESSRGLMYIFSTPYRTRLLHMALIWFLTYICTQNGVTFFKEFAVHERGWSDADVAAAITIAAVASMPMVFFAGRLLDWVGRRRGALLIFSVSSAGVFGCYTLNDRWALTAALVLGIFGSSAVTPVLNAFTTELFPTELRGDAFAWANNLLGRIGYVLSPAAVGYAAREVGWGPAVSATAIFPLIAVGLIFWLLPETRGKELEETAAV